MPKYTQPRNTESTGHPLVDISNINKLVENETQCGCDNSPVEFF